EPGISAMIRAALEGYDCEFVTVISGEDAVKQIRSSKFDLIFLDIILPGINGIQVLKEVKRTTPSTPVVIMTGFFNNGLMEEASDLGVVAFMRKPGDFTPDFIKQVFQVFKLRGGPSHSIFARPPHHEPVTIFS